MGHEKVAESSTYAVRHGTDVESREEVVTATKTWKSYIWDTWELPDDQRKFLFKVDAFILTFASVRTTRHATRLSYN